MRDLLVKHGISEYKELELLRYDPDEEDKYGRVVFEEESMAANAVKLLYNATVGDRPIDVALLTNRTKLFGRSTVLNITKTDVKADINTFLGSDEILSCQMYPKEDRFAYMFLQCKSPARALRALSKLSSYRYLNQPVPFSTANDFVVIPHGVLVRNIHSNIRQKDLTRILDELLGPGRMARLTLPFSEKSGISKGFAYVYFHSAEQARRAVEILNDHILMDRTLKATLDDRPSNEDYSAKYTEYKAYLGNIDVNTTQESIEKLCNDVLAGASASAGVGGVSTVQFVRTSSGDFLSCIVHFTDAASRDLCVSALHGTKWHDRELFCNVAVERSSDDWHFPQGTKIYLRYFPRVYSQEQATSVIEDILGEKTLRGIRLGRENGPDTRGVCLKFFTEDQAKRAMEALNGKIIKGIKQRALPSLTVEQLSRYKSGTFESVYIGNLPLDSDIDQLRDLLVKHGISEYKELELLRYNPDEEDKYGRVVFEEESMAANAVELLHNATVDDRPIDVALLTNRTKLFGRSAVLNITKTDVKADINAFLGSDEILSCHMYPSEDQFAFMFLDFKSPAHALRALSKLSSYRYLNQPVQFCTSNDYVLRPHGVFVGNIHPNIKHKDLARILDELVGPGQVARVMIPFSANSGISKGFAFVYFHSADQARRAVEILNGRVLMDRTLKATLDCRSNDVTQYGSAKYTEFKAYLGNIDPSKTQESIEKLCNDTLAGSSGSAGVGGVTAVKFLRSKSGVFLPSCFVYFTDASSRDLCASALNGTKWNDRELFCNVVMKEISDDWHFPQGTKVYLKYFPRVYSQELAARVIEEILGEKTLRGLHLGKETGQDTRGVHLMFFTEDQAKRAIEVLNKSHIQGIKQRAFRP